MASFSHSGWVKRRGLPQCGQRDLGSPKILRQSRQIEEAAIVIAPRLHCSIRICFVAELSAFGKKNLGPTSPAGRGRLRAPVLFRGAERVREATLTLEKLALARPLRKLAPPPAASRRSDLSLRERFCATGNIIDTLDRQHR